MLIILAIFLALIPATAVLYPFLSGKIGNEWLDDEASPLADLQRRWDAAISGINNAELEFSIGNLDEEDYRWLRQQYMREAAIVMRAMELEEEQEEDLLQAIEQEILNVRNRALGTNDTTLDGLQLSSEHQASQEPAGG